jgi:hypothetical protein
MDIPLAKSDYFRGVAKEAQILMRNRYFEQNPVLTATQAALLARMGMRRYMFIGQGPIRGLYSQPGSFSDALFVVSGETLYRVDRNGVQTVIGIVPGSNPNTTVKMAATSNIGETPAYLFVAGGSTLMLYMEDGYAIGTISGSPANGNVVRIGGTYYQFTNASVNAGAPAGTVANPWLVALGVSDATAWTNFFDAIGNQGTPGTQYSTALVINPDVIGTNNTGGAVSVRSKFLGALGNATITTETGGAIAWGAGTLTGGGGSTWTPVETPDDVGIIDLGYIASYVVAVPAQGQGINGRFFWIDPGETVIDPLDFATAERAPDPISGVAVFGDNFWLPGQNTTEVWGFTGNDDSPVTRVQGVVFDRGSWEGTAIQVKDSMIVVDDLGGVFQIQGGAKRISRPDIEQQIREAIQFQESRSFI